jgi:hypothetical protein
MATAGVNGPYKVNRKVAPSRKGTRPRLNRDARTPTSNPRKRPREEGYNEEDAADNRRNKRGHDEALSYTDDALDKEDSDKNNHDGDKGSSHDANEDCSNDRQLSPGTAKQERADEKTVVLE